jgi:hypothetical protein
MLLHFPSPPLCLPFSDLPFFTSFQVLSFLFKLPAFVSSKYDTQRVSCVSVCVCACACTCMSLSVHILLGLFHSLLRLVRRPMSSDSSARSSGPSTPHAVMPLAPQILPQILASSLGAQILFDDRDGMNGVEVLYDCARYLQTRPLHRSLVCEWESKSEASHDTSEH